MRIIDAADLDEKKVKTESNERNMSLSRPNTLLVCGDYHCQFGFRDCLPQNWSSSYQTKVMVHDFPIVI